MVEENVFFFQIYENCSISCQLVLTHKETLNSFFVLDNFAIESREL